MKVDRREFFRLSRITAMGAANLGIVQPRMNEARQTSKLAQAAFTIGRKLLDDALEPLEEFQNRFLETFTEVARAGYPGHGYSYSLSLNAGGLEAMSDHLRSHAMFPTGIALENVFIHISNRMDHETARVPKMLISYVFPEIEDVCKAFNYPNTANLPPYSQHNPPFISLMHGHDPCGEVVSQFNSGKHLKDHHVGVLGPDLSASVDQRMESFTEPLRQSNPRVYRSILREVLNQMLTGNAISI